MNKSEKVVLETTIKRLQIFCDSADENCGVSAESREEAKIYISTWVLTPLLTLRESLNEKGTRTARDKCVLLAKYMS